MNVGHVRATGRRLVTPGSRKCVPVIRSGCPVEGSVKKVERWGKIWDKEREKGNSKMEGKSPHRGKENV